MLVTSFASWFSPNPNNPSLVDRQNTYALNFNMTGKETSDYKLIISVHDQQKSKLHPGTNYNKSERVTLKYDPSQHIFYSTRKNINQLFTINDTKTQQSGKQQIKGILPMIALGRNSYYYIKGEWYGSGYDDNLFKEYYR